MTEWHFQHPEYFWALAVVLPLIVLQAWLGRVVARWPQRALCVFTRSLWVAACVAALAAPIYRKTHTETCTSRVIFLEDHSGSVLDDQQAITDAHREIARRLGPDVGRAELCFAGGVWAPGEAPLEPDQTDIAAALDAANAQSRDVANCHIVLLTDGRATRGASEEAAHRLALRGATVHAVPVGRPRATDPHVVRIDPPTGAHVGVPSSLRVVIDTPRSLRARVRLIDSNGQPMDDATLHVESRTTVLMHFTPKKAGILEATVELTPLPETADATAPVAVSAPTVDTRPVAVFVEEAPRVLIAEAFVSEADPLVRALAALHIPIDVVSPDNWPTRLDAYAAIVISDWSGRELAGEQRTALRRYVEERGGGLVFIGGGNVMPARWNENPLAAVLPVVLRDEPPQAVRKQKESEASVCFVLDRSGSMAGSLGTIGNTPVSKMDMVKAAVHASLENLPENTHVAVVVFDSAADVVVPSTPVSAGELIGKQVDGVSLGGGTDMQTGLRKGLDALKAMPGDKYLVVLTDGITQPPPGGMKAWNSMAGEAVRARIAWTSIAVGADADQKLLRALANAARGQFFFCATGNQIPEVFIAHAKAIKRVAETPKKKSFQPRAGPAADRLKAKLVEALPELDGNVTAETRREAEVVLWAIRDQPLLADWQFGAGRVIAFTSAAKPNWAKNWLTWGEFSSFWVQVVQSVLRPEHRLFVRVQNQSRGNHALFLFRVLDDQGRPAHDLKTSAALAAGADFTKLKESVAGTAGTIPVSWRSGGPGEYEASADLPAEDKRYVISMTLSAIGGREVNYCSMVTGEVSNEMANTGPDAASLRALAGAGHGVYSADPEEIATVCSRQRKQSITQQTPLWPYLIMAAIFLWPFDLLARRSISS